MSWNGHHMQGIRLKLKLISLYFDIFIMHLARFIYQSFDRWTNLYIITLCMMGHPYRLIAAWSVGALILIAFLGAIAKLIIDYKFVKILSKIALEEADKIISQQMSKNQGMLITPETSKA